MNNSQLEKKVRLDAAKVSKDVNNLIGDSTVRLSRFEDSVSKAKEDVVTWVDDNVTQLSDGLEKAAGDARETLTKTTATVKKEVGQGLSQYNAKAQKVANQVPGDFGVKAARYPWVAMSFALAIGFLLGLLLKPTRVFVNQN